jgi:hypothetical protein
MDLSSLENEYYLNEINNSWDEVYDEARYNDDKHEYEYDAALSDKNRLFNRYKNALPC